MTTSLQPPSDSPNLRGFDVAGMLRRLAAGAALEDLLRESPGLSPEDLRACFAYAAEVFSSIAPPPAKIETVEWTAESAAESATLPPPVAEAATMPPNGSSTSLLPGKRISLPGYEILSKIGEGGMGVVYKARHLRLNRFVAIKMILAGEHASDAMIARFALEAEAVAQLQHPGIVQIHEIGEHDGHSFLALEYVAGGSLAARLNDKPWSADKAAELVETLARTMQVAHDNGIVHRDLKPENVLLAEMAAEADGKLTPKITDFGLAKRLQETAGRTRTGEIMGTPSYMAPEQAAGKKDIGPAADIYALGAILYRLLTGRPPFQAETALDTMMLVLEQEPVSLRNLNKSLPRDLETIALKCLAKEPAKRYAHAAELADDLRRYMDGEPIKARRLSVRQRLFRWCRKRPGAAFARGTLLLLQLALVVGASISQGIVVGLASSVWIFSVMLFFDAVARTRLRPFLIGLSLSIVLPIITGICFKVAGDREWIPTFMTSRQNGEKLAIVTCLLPWLLGLVTGVFSRRLWRILGFCLVIAFQFAVLYNTDLGGAAIVASLIGLYFGMLCRIVRWHCDGNLIDSLAGSLWGAVVAYFLSAMIFGLLAMGLFQGAAEDPNSLVPVMTVFIVLCAISGVFGSIFGAYLGAIVGKKGTRRGQG